MDSTERSTCQYQIVDRWGKGRERGKTVDEKEEGGFLGMVICISDISRCLKSQNGILRDNNLN